ncbi:MAG: Fis family transcriptional regulator [Crenarchaeota archaeon]|nr:Fis family transcriptional regulator [Thermoproteota archaeon]
MDMMRVTVARALGRPVALCDVGDPDGVISCAIFVRKYRNATVVLRAPAQVVRSRWLKLVRWDFVADLPCPPGSRVKMRADHHKTNPPCAEKELYDPSAPCAAILAAKLLGLDNDEHVKKIVSIAIESDTANIVTEEAKLIDLAVRYSGYRTKLRMVRLLAEMDVRDVLRDEAVARAVERGLEAERLMEHIVRTLPDREIITVYFPKMKDFRISFRQLNIKIQKEKRAKFINILVRRGFRTYRLYCGADKDGPYDCTQIVTRLGGGGHKFAAGAQYKAPLFKPGEGLNVFIRTLKEYLNTNRIELYIVRRGPIIERLEV